MRKSRSVALLKILLAYAIEFGRACTANLVASRLASSTDIFVIKECRMACLSLSLRSAGRNSSQRYIKVVNDANLIFMFSLDEVACKLVIKSSHSPLGISIEPIAEST